jgi:DNA-binding NtrC family response regulator
MNQRILIVEDDRVLGELFAEVLASDGYATDWVESGEDAITRLEEGEHDLALIDLHLPGMTGLETTRKIRAVRPDVPVIVMTAFGSLETAAEAIRDGAFDYVSKPIDVEQLKLVARRALTRPSECRRDRAAAVRGHSRIIGTTRPMIDLYKTIARVAPLRSTILLIGESGTGKELLARSIHDHSARASRLFLPIDCGALPETLLESELFGHVRGAFTGALTDKKGLFEEADGATCFLDEIGDISAGVQAKLLRVLQEGAVRRVGGRQWINVDVRIVAATNKDLSALVRAGTFRQDLFYRLNVVTIPVPPLRTHIEDVPALAQHFVELHARENGKAVSGLSQPAMQALCGYGWPGNVRELENAIASAVAMAGHRVITRDDLPLHVAGRDRIATTPSAEPKGDPFADSPTLEEVKRRYIQHVLGRSRANIASAARQLGVDRRSLYRMMSRYSLIPAPRRERT